MIGIIVDRLVYERTCECLILVKYFHNYYFISSGHPLDLYQFVKSMTSERLFGRASDRRDGTSLENLLHWIQHPLSALCSQQSFLRKLRSPVFGFNSNKRSSRSKVLLIIVLSCIFHLPYFY